MYTDYHRDGSFTYGSVGGPKINFSVNQNDEIDNNEKSSSLITDLNASASLVSVAIGLLDEGKVDVLKPKGNVIQHQNPRLNKVNIGIAKDSSKVLIPTSKFFKFAGKSILVGAVAYPVIDVFTDMRNPMLSGKAKVASMAKATLDLSIVAVAAGVGGPIGAGIAITYLAADYFFDFKSFFASPMCCRRDEEYTHDGRN